jgi:hypothetical protein
MAKEHAPWNIEEGKDWVKRLGPAAAADHYRRIYSKDKITVRRYWIPFLNQNVPAVFMS